MKQLNIFLIIPLVILLGACSKKTQPLLTYEQSTSPFLHSLPSLHPNLKNFKARFFMPWHINSINIDEEKAAWANIVFKRKGKYFAENKRPWEEQEIKTIIENTNFENFNKEKIYAITTRQTQVRNLPTHRPFLKNPKLAGEGFAFDYLQNTLLHVNEPIFISHLSKDKAWAFVQSQVSTGWIPVNSFKRLDAKEQTRFFQSSLVLITKDDTPLYDLVGNYVLHVKLGALFPIIDEQKDFFVSYIYKNKKILVKIPKDISSRFPLTFNKNNLAMITNQLLNERYGWGGFMNNRDCSAMTRDYFLSFGKWLPRNSFSQSKSGDYISLENLSDEEKEKMLQKYAIPFESLLYLHGHIMLYIGTKNGKSMVMHNTWGIAIEKEGKEQRDIIGKAIVSDLYLGNNQNNIIEKRLLIKRLKGFVIRPINTNTGYNPITKAYTKVLSIHNNTVYFDDNTTLNYDDKKEKTGEEKIQNADIEDMISEPYAAFTKITPPIFDTGRYRNEAFLKKLYGSNKKEVEKNLIKLTWVDGTKLYFNKQENAAKQLQKVINDLKLLPHEYQKYITHIAGSYNYRYVSGTNRLSAHSFGIAIDLNVKHSAYWKWDKKYNYRNQIPKKIVEIFEKHGFIWGGRWYHYDTMHFEYRPELFLNID